MRSPRPLRPGALRTCDTVLVQKRGYWSPALDALLAALQGTAAHHRLVSSPHSPACPSKRPAHDFFTSPAPWCTHHQGPHDGLRTPPLAAAVSAAGGLGMLGCGMRSPAAMAEAAAAVRQQTKPALWRRFCLCRPRPP